MYIHNLINNLTTAPALGKFVKNMYIYVCGTRSTPAEAETRKNELANERWGAGVETQKNARGEIGGWGRVPFNEPYAPSLSTIYDRA